MKNINLTLPTSYNRCTPAQLRAIASVIAECGERAAMSRFRIFDPFEAKVGIFFVLTGIEVVSPVNPAVPVEQQYYVCRLRPYSLEDEHKWHGLYRKCCRSIAWIKRNVFRIDNDFQLYLYQIHSWLTPRKNVINGKEIPGMLDWIDSSSGDHLYNFPIPEIKRRRAWYRRRLTFQGTNPLMDGFSWKRYRFCQDFMEMYVNASNRLLALSQNRKASPTDILKATKHVDLAQSLFLATVFSRKVKYVDSDTGRITCDYRYTSNQHSDCSPYFRNFPTADWQLILLWWEGQMHYLAKRYPKVFKKTPVNSNKKPTDPLALYTRTTATIEKYLHITAEEIDNEPYTTVIQQMEDMIRHNEEMERINRRSKK